MSQHGFWYQNKFPPIAFWAAIIFDTRRLASGFILPTSYNSKVTATNFRLTIPQITGNKEITVMGGEIIVENCTCAFYQISVVIIWSNPQSNNMDAEYQ